MAFYARGFYNSDGLGKSASGGISDYTLIEGEVDYKLIPPYDLDGTILTYNYYSCIFIINVYVYLLLMYIYFTRTMRSFNLFSCASYTQVLHAVWSSCKSYMYLYTAGIIK